MKKVVKDYPADSVSSEYADVGKVYIYTDEGGIHKLCQVGEGLEAGYSWVYLNGTYTSSITKHSKMQSALNYKLERGILEFDTFVDFCKWYMEQQIK